MPPTSHWPFPPLTGLGQLKALHTYNKLSILHRVFALSSGLLFIGGALWSVFKLSPLQGYVFMAMLVASGITFNVWHDQRNWPRAAALYEYGFAYYDCVDLIQVRWEQIKKLKDEIQERVLIEGVVTSEGSTEHYYTVHVEGGQQIVLRDHLHAVEALWAAIEAGVVTTVLPDYLHAVQAGQAFSFGPFLLDRHGLGITGEHTDKFIEFSVGPFALKVGLPEKYGNKFIGWPEVQSVQAETHPWPIEFDQVVVKGKGSQAAPGSIWARVMKYQIPDVHIFCALCVQLTAGARHA